MSKFLLRKKARSSGLVTAVLIASVVLGGAAEGLASTGPAKSKAKPKPKLRDNSFYYSAFNRRDPFKSLVDGMFVRNSRMDLIDLNSVELVGIVRGELDRFALLEDERGFSYILRAGDSVINGRVVSISNDTMVARVTNFGQTSKFTLHLVQRQQGAKR